MNMNPLNWLMMSIVGIGACSVLLWMMPVAQDRSQIRPSITVFAHHHTAPTTTPMTTLVVPINSSLHRTIDICAPACLVKRLLNPALNPMQFEQQLNDLQQHPPVVVAAVLLDAALALSSSSVSMSRQWDAIMQALAQQTHPQASLFLAQAFLERDELQAHLDQQTIENAIRQAVYHTTDRLTVGAQLYQQYGQTTNRSHQQRLLDLGSSAVLAHAWLDTRDTQTANSNQHIALQQAIAQSNDPHMTETFFKLNTSAQQHDELLVLSAAWMTQHATDDVIFTLEHYVRTTELTKSQAQFLQHLLENSTSPLAAIFLQKQIASTTAET